VRVFFADNAGDVRDHDVYSEDWIALLEWR
jgi:hypothetical protein